MSKLTVPQHLTHSTIFRVWLEEINGIIDEELEIYDLLETKAPIQHASEGTMYGIGNNFLYGHLKLTDNPSEELDADSGTAATPKAIYAVISNFTERIDALEEAFYSSLQELRTDMQEQIDELVESNAGKAPIYHASAEETYGKGNAFLYGHLKLNDTRSPLFGVDDGNAATPSAVQDAYDDAIAYVDGFNIDERFETVNRRVDDVEDDIDQLDSRVDAIESSIEDIQNDIYGLGTYFFSEDLVVDASKIEYGVYVFKDAFGPATLELRNCRPHFRATITNESDYTLTIAPDVGFTIGGTLHPIVLGKGDTAAFTQNPTTNEGVINWSLMSRETMLGSSTYETSSNIISINMASEKAQIFEVTAPCTVEFVLGDAESTGRTEYAEKSLLFIAKTSNARIVWPSNIIWMDALEAPAWGYASDETLMLKAYQFGDRILIEQKHNSHIVPGLDREVVKLI